MSKAKFLFRCKNCSALFNKWQGKCEQCSSWDTIEKLDEKLSQNTATSISKADRLGLTSSRARGFFCTDCLNRINHNKIWL